MSDDTLPRNNAEKTRGRPFQKGNPGRPPGSRNKATLAALALLEGEAEMLTQRAIEAAREGDMSALKLVMDRILPPRRRPLVGLDLEHIETLQDTAEASRQVIQAALDGGLTLDEAERLSKLVIAHAELHDQAEAEWRAQRYLNALFRRCAELRARLSTPERSVDDDARALVSERIPTFPEAVSPALFVSALAYYYECDMRDGGWLRAWTALPSSEKTILAQASAHFPFIEIPGE